MPLILAIEPDRRQAARIAALARGQLNAELIVTESTEHAIAALANRVPDLILTSLLLSPKDESRLRELDRAGRHVPTLMIPMLATAARSSRERPGLLKRLPWSRATPATTGDTEGCQPAVFAAQIAEYLDRAALERAALERAALEHAALEHAALEHDGSPKTTPDEEGALADQEQDAGEPAALKAVADLAEPLRLEPESIETELAAPTEVVAAPEVIAAPDVIAATEAVAAIEAPGGIELFTKTEAPAETEVLRDTDLLAEEILVESEILPDAEATWDELGFVNEALAPAIELSSETIDLRAFVEELEATMTAETSTARHEPAVDAQRALEAAVKPKTIRETTTGTHGRAAAIAHGLPGPTYWPALEGILADETVDEDIIEIVADFVAALEADAEPIEDEPESAWNSDPDSDLWMPLSADAGARWPRLESTCSRTRPKQDEWGFFDPEQCGFSALLAKLDQLTK